MHKKVQSLLITGVLSANMVGSTVAVFADDELRESDTKVEDTVKPNEEDDIKWETTTDDNYKTLWDNLDGEDNTIVLKKYIGKNKNVVIPKKINGKKVVLENLKTEVFPKVERIKVADGEGLIGLKETNLFNAFANNNDLKSLDLRGIDVSKVTDLCSFVSGASKLEEVNLSSWNVSKVTDMSSLFYKASSLKNVDISGWSQSYDLENTRYMFRECPNLRSIDLSTLNMDNVTNAEAMFQECSSLEEIKGSKNWTLKNVKNIGYMFKGTKLNFIDLSNVHLPDISILPDYSMKLIFADSNVENLLVVTNDKRLIDYNYGEDKRTCFNLTFDTDGGQFNNESNPQTISEFTIRSDKAKLLSTPIRDGHEFERWEIQNDKKTVKAIWKKVEGEKPEVNPEKPEVNPEKPEVNPEKPEVNPEKPEVNPEKPEVNPEKPEVNPEKPGGGTDNDNTTVEQPVLDGTDKDNIMIHPLECLPSVYTLVDENMVSITQRGDGTENNPVILQVKDSIYKVDLKHFINKFDTLNSNVSTIIRSDKYTEYKMTVDNKNLNDPTKSKTTNVIIRINNTKLDLLKEANKYSRRRNYNVQIPTIVKFSDVKDNFWGRSCIEDFASMGVVDGYPNNEFKPNNSITRAEFVRIINNAFGYTKPIDNVKFNDVEKNSWYYNDIAIALKQGYINGRSETTFSPNDNITREEVAMMLTNIMNNKDNDFNRLNSFNDGNKTSDWAKAAVAGAIKAGYLIGDDQKNLSPTKNMTRAEAIASLSRVRPVK